MEHNERLESLEKEKRQHTISLPRPMFALLKRESEARGLTVGELNRSIVRCWIEGRAAPPRHAGEVGEVPKPAPAPRPPKMTTTMSAPPVKSPVILSSVPPPVLLVAPEVPRRLPDPDFDSPDTIAEAKRRLSGRVDEEVPF